MACLLLALADEVDKFFGIFRRQNVPPPFGLYIHSIDKQSGVQPERKRKEKPGLPKFRCLNEFACLNALIWNTKNREAEDGYLNRAFPKIIFDQQPAEPPKSDINQKQECSYCNEPIHSSHLSMRRESGCARRIAANVSDITRPGGDRHDPGSVRPPKIDAAYRCV